MFKMNKSLLFSLLFSTTSLFGQVGVNTNTPNPFSSLDIDTENTGVLIPRVKLAHTKDIETVRFHEDVTLNETENSLMVYNYNTTEDEILRNLRNGNQTTQGDVEIEGVYPGFYYWEKDRWIRLSNMENNKPFFYMPSILIPTHLSQISSDEQSIRSLVLNTSSESDRSTTTLDGVIDLYAFYKQQFNSSGIIFNESRSTSLPMYKKNQLDYYITWYDNKIFDEVKVSDDGILTYKVINSGDSVVFGSFMNIVFAVK